MRLVNLGRSYPGKKFRRDLFRLQRRIFKVFNKEKNMNRHTAEELVIKAFPKVSYSENKQINVKGNKSPYDGDLTYWSERNSKLYDDNTVLLP
jgi:RNA-directed DNA polymerase